MIPDGEEGTSLTVVIVIGGSASLTFCFLGGRFRFTASSFKVRCEEDPVGPGVATGRIPSLKALQPGSWIEPADS
jgi:hypothetical protein